ncbi:kinase-like domain-containing protein [Mycena maculata]|uniref:Kinase-like domain-containing protein n=1 Tax=Mycena maculata TaxID=230809 RepID=A0AAD7J937_9AGAR|nr:kinase-like domain-containing protein [Mycena maculata]
MFEDALAHLLRHWNLDWEKKCSESLTPEHISLCLLGNLGIQPHSTLGTVGQFFDAHDHIHGNHPKKILQGPTTLRLPSPAIYLEGLIVVKEFEDRTGTLAPYFVHTEKENRKRKGIRGPGLNSTKHTRSQLSTPLPTRSEFADLPGFTKVDFVFAPVSVAQDGLVTIEWLDRRAPDDITTWTCPIQDVPFDQGKTKVVYKVIFDGLPWVAKWFFDVGAGTGQVEIQENHNEVVKEATRLSKLGYFLKRFLTEAKRQGVDIEHGIQVTDFRLGIEVVEDSGPSTASGFSLEQYQAAGDPDIIVWLFEPRRSSKNKIGSTLNAFAHYAYLFSQESTVLADLQTATAIDENGEGIQVLFDVMTHTLNGSSGVGDHGKTGIETFLRKHECVNRCKYLHLSREGFESDSELPPEESDDD